MSRKSHSSETKSVVIGRHFLSFVLFLVIAALSLTVFVRADCVDGKKYASIFTNEKYVQSLYGDVKQYAYDMCAQNGIPTDSVDEVITYDAVYNTVNAYAVGNFDNSQDYTKTTYEDRISELNTQLAQKTEDMIGQYKINTADNANKACKKFSNDICDYLKSRSCLNILISCKPFQTSAKLFYLLLPPCLRLSAQCFLPSFTQWAAKNIAGFVQYLFRLLPPEFCSSF